MSDRTLVLALHGVDWELKIVCFARIFRRRVKPRGSLFDWRFLSDGVHLAVCRQCRIFFGHLRDSSSFSFGLAKAGEVVWDFALIADFPICRAVLSSISLVVGLGVFLTSTIFA